MLNGQTVKVKVGGDFTPVPMDKYTVQITDVDLVKQFNQWKGAEVDMLKYQFTILDEKPMPDGETTRGRLLWSRVSLNVGSRSTFGKLLVAAFGRELTKEELENLNPEALVGLQVDVMVDATPDKKDPTTIYNNILSFSKTLKPLATVEAKPNAGQTVVQKTTVPAVAPDAENPDAFISQMEQEAKAATVTPAQPQAVAAAPVAPAAAGDDAEALALEAEAAELAAKAAAARAKATAAQQGKAV